MSTTYEATTTDLDSRTEADDARDLAALGYRQELKRDLGSFSAFAAGFSYVSILTTVFQLFVVGFGLGGTRFFWTWPIVFVGQLAVGLCFAELGSHYPVAGSVYQWGKRMSPGFFGFLPGWLKLIGDIVSVAAAAIALQAILPSLSPVFQLVGGDASLESPTGAMNAVLLGVGLVALTTLVNVLGVRAMAAVNNVGVLAELSGVVLVLVALFTHAVRGPEVVLHSIHAPSPPLGTGLAGLLASALMPAYVLYGFDSAGALAEETHRPRRVVPRAILRALFVSGIGGGLLLLAALMAAPSLTDGRLASTGLAYVILGALGGPLGKLFLLDIAIAVGVCTLTIQTGTSRLAFAMARDGMLPFARSLAHVSPRTKSPVLPAVVVGVLAVVLLALNYGQAQLFVHITETAVLLVNVAYLLVTLPMIAKRLSGWPSRAMRAAEDVFSLGDVGMAVNVGAVLWGLALVVNIGWPRVALDDGGSGSLMPYVPLIGVSVAAFVGVLVFGTRRRDR